MSSTEPRSQSFIEKTQFAPKYQSRWAQVAEPDEDLLANLNCSYFSTPRTAPTLLDLKRHAQSLAILIRDISVSSSFGDVDGENSNRGHVPKLFREHEAFDWLNDLSEQYDNDDEWHQKPLTELMNLVADETDLGGVHLHCPLTQSRRVDVQADGTKRRPYANHAQLAHHANECLEMLDHEYGATGGLMSLLPTDDKADQWEMDLASNTLLGQWLLFNQALVGRTHELELAYANAVDALQGEAVVPLQSFSKTAVAAAHAGTGAGPIPTAESLGREVAYPQDRWVLVNAGEDVLDHVHRTLDKMEAQIEPKERAWKAAGVVGEQIWRSRRGGDAYDAGLVVWDVKTRYLRLRGKGRRSPVFVMPAHGVHPAVSETRSLEAKPGVVSVVTPTWPTRVSDWERKYVSKLDQATKTEIEVMRLRKANANMEEEKRRNGHEMSNLKHSVAMYEDYFGADRPDEDLEGPAKQRVMQYRSIVEDVRLRKKMWEDLRDALPRKYWGLMDKLRRNAVKGSQEEEGPGNQEVIDLEEGDGEERMVD